MFNFNKKPIGEYRSVEVIKGIYKLKKAEITVYLKTGKVFGLTLREELIPDEVQENCAPFYKDNVSDSLKLPTKHVFLKRNRLVGFDDTLEEIKAFTKLGQLVLPFENHTLVIHADNVDYIKYVVTPDKEIEAEDEHLEFKLYDSKGKTSQ